MGDQLGTDELGDERAELLPDREVLSLLSDPTAMEVAPLLGPPESAGSGAAGYASSTPGAASTMATDNMPETSTGEPYSATETASAG